MDKLLKKDFNMKNLLKKYGGRGRLDDANVGRNDEIWSLDLGKHNFGDFSYAAVKSAPDMQMEDLSQVDVCDVAISAGIYDGHGGVDAGLFVSQYIVPCIARHAHERSKSPFEEAIRSGFAETEKRLLEMMMNNHNKEGEDICEQGCGGLVFFIFGKKLFVANVGDSRALFGVERKGKLFTGSKICAEQMTSDHNINIEKVRLEFDSFHPKDRFAGKKDAPNDVPNDKLVEKGPDGIWRIKSYLELTRSFGNLVMKIPEISNDHPNRSIPLPIISAIPDVYSFSIKSHDKFIVLASRGLWAHLSNDYVVKTVVKNPHSGIAKRLIEEAIKVAEKKQQKTANEINRGTCHDDITVVVIFLDHDLLASSEVKETLSVTAFNEPQNTSVFFNQIRGEDEAGSSSSSIPTSAGPSISDTGGFDLPITSQKGEELKVRFFKGLQSRQSLQPPELVIFWV